MAKVLTFSRTFPAYHPRKGEPTFFVEKILNSLYPDGFDFYFDDYISTINPTTSEDILNAFQGTLEAEVKEAKGHTLRAGSRWKAGDKFSPRVWSGKPYNSKQIIIAPDIEVKKIFRLEQKNGKFYLNYKKIDISTSDIPINDGLNKEDFLKWFPSHKKFVGQIICWNEKVNY